MSKLIIYSIFLILKFTPATFADDISQPIFETRSNGMCPYIMANSLLLLEPYTGTSIPQKNDVVIFTETNSNTIRTSRVIAIPGDRIEIKNGTTYINKIKIKISEPYLKTSEHCLQQDITLFSKKFGLDLPRQDDTPYFSTAGLPEFILKTVETKIRPNEYFLLSDHRYSAVDSRSFGPIKTEKILGKAIPWGNDYSNIELKKKYISKNIAIAKEKLPFTNDEETIVSLNFDERNMHISSRIILNIEKPKNITALELKKLSLPFHCKTMISKIPEISTTTIYTFQNDEVVLNYQPKECATTQLGRLAEPEKHNVD